METPKNLIVGFTGGIGRATAKALIESGESVKLLVRSEEKARKYLDGLENYQIVVGDASDPSDVNSALEGCERLFYCANVPYPEWYTKLIPLFRVSVDACIAQKKKFIFPGNVYVYGKAQFNPVTEGHPHHALTRKGKLREEMEQYLGRAFREGILDYTIVRMPDFYGPYVINGFTEQLFISSLKGKTIRWYGNPKIETEFIYIEDGGKAMAIAGLSDKSSGLSFNVPGYAPVKAKDMMKMLSDLGGKRSGISISDNDSMLAIAGLFNKMVYEVKEMMYLKKEKLVLSGSFFKGVFGELPARSYQQGIKETLEWAKKYYGI